MIVRRAHISIGFMGDSPVGRSSAFPEIIILFSKFREDVETKSY